MSDQLLCPNCGKEHVTNNKNCDYCGHNLEAEILEFKEKHLPVKYERSLNSIEEKTKEKEVTGMEFYKQIKEAEKRRRRYGDKQLKDDLDRCSPFYCTYRTRTREQDYRREMEIKKRDMKVKKIPKKRTLYILSIPPVLLFLGMIAVGIVFYLNPELFGEWPEERLFSLIFIEVGIMLLTLITLIPVRIISSLIKTEGKAFCYSESRYRGRSSILCDNCGFSFLLALVSILFSGR